MRLLLSILLSILALQCFAPPVNSFNGDMVKWGQSYTGDSGADTTLTSIKHVSANTDWALALKSDGSLFAWGSNGDGQTNAPAGTTYVHCFAGWRHGIAAKSDGSIVEWGTPFGETIETWTSYWPPNMTANWSTDKVIQVAAGDDHSMALTQSGIVYIWGGRSEVTNLNETISDGVMIAAGWYNILVAHENGTVTSTGQESQAGQNFTAPTFDASVIYVNCSQWSCYAIDANGKGYAWGMPNDLGQFTFGSEMNSGVVSLSGGRDHTIMAKSDGTVYTYGDDGFGQKTIPSAVTTGKSIWINGGRLTSFAILGLPPVAVGRMRLPFGALQ